MEAPAPRPCQWQYPGRTCPQAKSWKHAHTCCSGSLRGQTPQNHLRSTQRHCVVVHADPAGFLHGGSAAADNGTPLCTHVPKTFTRLPNFSGFNKGHQDSTTTLGTSSSWFKRTTLPTRMGQALQGILGGRVALQRIHAITWRSFDGVGNLQQLVRVACEHSLSDKSETK